MATRAELTIIAGNLADLASTNPAETVEQIAERANRDGWTFAIRYPGRPYLDDRGHTLVEGMRLGPTALAEVIARAKAILVRDHDWPS